MVALIIQNTQLECEAATSCTDQDGVTDVPAGTNDETVCLAGNGCSDNTWNTQLECEAAGSCTDKDGVTDVPAGTNERLYV